MIYGTIGTEYKYDVNDPKFKTAFEFLLTPTAMQLSR